MLDSFDLSFNKGWSIGEEAFDYICGIIRNNDFQKMIEFGSGISTVRWALAFPWLSVVSFEHYPRIFHRTERYIQKYNVQSQVELRYAPLRDVWIGGRRFFSYAKPEFRSEYDIIVVDGPPTHLTKWGREACLYYAYDVLRMNGIVILDDVNQREEKMIAQKWLDVYPGSFEYSYINIGHGLGVFKKAKHLNKQRILWRESLSCLSQYIRNEAITAPAIKNASNCILAKATGYRLSRYVRPAVAERPDYPSYRDALKTFLGTYKDLISGKVLEIGPGTWEFVRILVESLGGDIEFFALDPSPSSCSVIRGTIEQIEGIFTHKFHTIIACDVFEHLRSPESTIRKVYEFLEDGGVFIASSPFRKNLHGEEYGDYWRITRQGWAYLLGDFREVEIVPHGDPLFPKAYFVIAVK